MENRDSKQILITLLSFIRDCELEKPLDEINMGLVEACVKLLLKLQEKEVIFTAEQIKERVRKIPFVLTPDFGEKTTKKVKKHTTKKKILLVAAIITLLAMLLSVIPFADEQNVFDYVRDYIGYENVITDKEYEYNGMSFKSNEIIEDFDDIEDYPEDNPYGILLPAYLPDGIYVENIRVIDMVDYTKINVFINDSSFGYIIKLDSQLPQVIPEDCEETVTLNGLSVYIVYLQDIGRYQTYFEHNGNCYELNFTDKQELLKVIENLEE